MGRDKVKQTMNGVSKVCSDEKQCVHPDPAFVLGCGYRKVLASGRGFCGKKRNAD